MDTNMERLEKVLQGLNLTEKCQSILTILNQIKTSEQTRVVVTGMRSSGKTRLINKLVGQEVREPGNMDDDEPVLRVAFEPMAEEKGMECVVVANSAWHEREAVIYELRENNVLFNNQLANNMFLADYVLFLISAAAPFNSQEIQMLKTLSPLTCQVCVMSLDVVTPDQRDRVKSYIEKINASLGLPEVIYVLEDESQDIGRIIRNELPSYTEKVASRENRYKFLLARVFEQLRTIIKAKMDEEEKDFADRMSTNSTIEKKIYLNCYTICNEVEDDRKKIVKYIKEILKTDTKKALAEVGTYYLKNKTNPDIENTVDKYIREKYSKLTENAFKRLEKEYLKQLERTHNEMTLLGVIDWTDDTYNQLAEQKPSALMNSHFEKVKRTIKDTVLPNNSVESKLSRGYTMTKADKRVFLYTSAAVGGFVLAPIPPLATILGTAAAIGLGSVKYLEQKRANKDKDFIGALKIIFDDAQFEIVNLIEQYSKESYQKIVDAVRFCGEQHTVTQSDDNKYKLKMQKWQNLYDMCVMES